MTAGSRAANPTTAARMAERISALWRRAAEAMSVRMKVVGLVVLLTMLGFTTAGVAAYVVESTRIESQIDEVLAQEVDEFQALATTGVDPRTGKPIGSISRLLRVAMLRNVPAANERILGFVHGKVRFFQGEQGTGTVLRNDPGFLAAVQDVLPGAGFASVQTREGPVRFAVKPVRQGEQSGAYVVAYFSAADYAEFDAVVRTFVFVASSALLLVAVAAWLLTGRLLQPLQRLRHTATEIHESDLTRRIEVSGTDDISRLAITFNEMLDRLEGAFAAQRQFLDDAGHELRTPITIARGHLELLQVDDAADTESTRTVVLDELDRMGRLVEDLVALAKAERPDFLRLGVVDLAQLTDELLAKARTLGDYDWHLDSRADGVARIDAQRVTQAIMQLADNATRFTPTGGVIALGTAFDAGTLNVWVRDTGTGVPPGHEDRVFDRFERGNSESGTGSGLGLSIVTAIAAAHGGRVRLDNRPGWGATFTVSIPIQLQPSPDPPDAGRPPLISADVDAREVG